MSLVTKLGIQERSIGILTKADQYNNKDVPLGTINTYGAPGFTALEYGWTITSSKPPPDDSLSKLDRLEHMRQSEEELLNGIKGAKLHQAHASLQSAFKDFLCQRWAPDAIAKLAHHAAVIEVEVRALGLPYDDGRVPTLEIQVPLAPFYYGRPDIIFSFLS